MPEKRLPAFIFAFLTLFIVYPLLSLSGYEGISMYYARYDVKSSNNRLVDDNLLVAPSAGDFRGENFSLVSISGAISAVDRDPSVDLDTLIQNNALKGILVKNGLKSVQTKDFDTIVSYEGLIKAPVQIIRKSYIEEQNHIMYEAQVEFSPIAFPEKWEYLGVKNRLKGVIKNFIELFK